MFAQRALVELFVGALHSLQRQLRLDEGARSATHLTRLFGLGRTLADDGCLWIGGLTTAAAAIGYRESLDEWVQSVGLATAAATG